MDNSKMIEITRVSSEGAGCYGCRLYAVCSLRRGLWEVINGHSGFMLADKAGGVWSDLVAVVGESCSQFEAEGRVQ